ncbi:MAG TPA: hypothetical protein DD789_10930, partial [Firmicutes bacterium]|nr:hypothetical protein [Bacillota bacterium]
TDVKQLNLFGSRWKIANYTGHNLLVGLALLVFIIISFSQDLPDYLLLYYCWQSSLYIMILN